MKIDGYVKLTLHNLGNRATELWPLSLQVFIKNSLIKILIFQEHVEVTLKAFALLMK